MTSITRGCSKRGLTPFGTASSRLGVCWSCCGSNVRSHRSAGGKRMRPSFVVLAMLGVAAGANHTLPPWGAKSHPTDAPKRHVEKVAVGRHVYVVRQGGTMDGANCRSPIGVGMSDGPAIEQTWESNRAVRLENT